MKPHSRYKIARRWLLFWTLFIGLGAVAGALGMLLDPSGRALGMDAMLPYFQVLPFADVVFQDFTFSGWALLIVNGLTNLTAAGLLLARKRAGVILGDVFGVTLMLWICIQFYMFPPNFMSTIYFFFGLAQAATGWAAWVFWQQESFQVDITQYPHIATNPDRLVVFFSRMGYVRRIAYEAAERTGAAVYGMHHWDMPIEPVTADLTAYAHVTVCAPIWVFALAAPVRTFCRAAAGKIREADYILVHHQNSRYENAAAEMDALLGLYHTPFTTLRCREGHYKEIKA